MQSWYTSAVPWLYEHWAMFSRYCADKWDDQLYYEFACILISYVKRMESLWWSLWNGNVGSRLYSNPRGEDMCWINKFRFGHTVVPIGSRLFGFLFENLMLDTSILHWLTTAESMYHLPIPLAHANYNFRKHVQFAQRVRTIQMNGLGPPKRMGNGIEWKWQKVTPNARPFEAWIIDNNLMSLQIKLYQRRTETEHDNNNEYK